MANLILNLIYMTKMTKDYLKLTKINLTLYWFKIQNCLNININAKTHSFLLFYYIYYQIFPKTTHLFTTIWAYEYLWQMSKLSFLFIIFLLLNFCVCSCFGWLEEITKVYFHNLLALHVFLFLSYIHVMCGKFFDFLRYTQLDYELSWAGWDEGIHFSILLLRFTLVLNYTFLTLIKILCQHIIS